jgi:hypothetical protein
MATIPTVLARRSLDVAGAVNVPTGSPVGEALERGGAKLAAVANTLMERQGRNDRFNALLGFDELKANIDGDFEKNVREAKPDGTGLHDTFLGGAQKRFQDFLATQPESVRPELESRWRAQTARESVRAARAEAGINENFHIKGIDERLQTGSNELMKNPAALDQWKRDVDERIEASNLTPDKKLAIREKVKESLTEAAFRGLGVNEKADVKAGWGMGRATVGEREKSAVEFFKGKGLSEVQAAAFVGRLSHESGGMNTNARNPGDGRDGSDSIGLGQWNAERAADLRMFAKAQGKPITDFQTQLEFVWQELNGRESGSLEKLKRARNAEEAGRAALDYERPRGWQAGDRYRSENVAGWRDQMARTKALLGDKAGDIAIPEDPRFKDIRPEKRILLAGLAEREEREQEVAEARIRTAELAGQKNQLQRQLQDGEAGPEEIKQAEDEGWLTDADEIQKFRNIITQREKGQKDERAFAAAIQQGSNYVWNPISKDDRDMANAGFKQLGGDVAAVERIVEHTGIVPPDAALALRGAMVSPNTQIVQSALEKAANLMRDRPQIFAGVEGAKDIEDKATTFNHLVYGRGFSAQEATKRIIEADTPEYKQRVTARIKGEDVNRIVKDNLKDGDIRAAFDETWGFGPSNPNLAFNPETRLQAMGHYEDAFREHYLQTGDVGEAKTRAIKELKKTWGVSEVNGTSTVMQYPPDRSPAYALKGVAPESVPQLYAAQLAEAVKARNGDEFDRSSLIFTPTKRTAEQYVRGEPPEYIISYRDKKNGTLETLPTAFFADPDKMRQDEIAVRQGVYETRRSAVAPAQEAVQERRTRMQENQQRLREEARQRILTTRSAVEGSEAASGTVVPMEDRIIEVERDVTGRPSRARVGTRRLNILRDDKGRFKGLEEED